MFSQPAYLFKTCISCLTARFSLAVGLLFWDDTTFQILANNLVSKMVLLLPKLQTLELGCNELDLIL